MGLIEYRWENGARPPNCGGVERGDGDGEIHTYWCVNSFAMGTADGAWRSGVEVAGLRERGSAIGGRDEGH